MKITDVASAMQKYLQKSGYNISYIPYTNVVQDCYAWYKNMTDWHRYFVRNGLQKIKCERARLGMAKMACEDWASLLMNERVKVTLQNENENVFVNEVLKNNHFTTEANKLVELMFALGTGAFVESLDNGIVIDYIHGDLIFPLKWDNGVITECAFAKIGGSLEKAQYTVILHIIEDGNYVIKTVEIDGDGGVCRPARPIQVAYGLNVVEEDSKEFTSIIYTNSDVPCFQIIKPHIVNNYDKTSPFGMGVIYNSVDILKSIDMEYDSLLNEFQLGKKRIFVKNGLKSIKQVNSKDAKNAIVNHIDPNDTMFYSLSAEGDDGKLPIQVFDPTLRTAEHQIALDMQLGLFSRAVGLGDGFYKFSNGNVARTATEIVSINSALFRNLNKHELMMTEALEGMVKAILTLSNIYLGTTFNVETPVAIEYDDSIIDDSEKTEQRAMAEFNAGLIDQVEYFAMTRFAGNRKLAQEFVAEMVATDTMKQVDTMIGMGNF